VLFWGAGVRAWLGRPWGSDERGERFAAAADFRGKPGGGAPRVLGLAGVPGGEDALVAGDEQGRGEQHQRGQAGPGGAHEHWELNRRISAKALAVMAEEYACED